MGRKSNDRRSKLDKLGHAYKLFLLGWGPRERVVPDWNVLRSPIEDVFGSVNARQLQQMIALAKRDGFIDHITQCRRLSAAAADDAIVAEDAAEAASEDSNDDGSLAAAAPTTPAPVAKQAKSKPAAKKPHHQPRRPKKKPHHKKSASREAISASGSGAGAAVDVVPSPDIPTAPRVNDARVEELLKNVAKKLAEEAERQESAVDERPHRPVPSDAAAARVADADQEKEIRAWVEELLENVTQKLAEEARAHQESAAMSVEDERSRNVVSKIGLGSRASVFGSQATVHEEAVEDEENDWVLVSA